ncbi:protein FAR1-RELATED SEQUENCE 5-like [Tasmannia lanceolata]|uniref:protein FAR1-RELATED SEQUENCE 5-like n=1 Tax=Tasmannia lanceolata TaxID=3420 RepID=UPI0040649C4C
MDPLGLSIEEVDTNRLITFDDTGSQVDGFYEAVGNKVMLVDEEEAQDALVSIDNEEGCSGTVETPNKDQGGSMTVNKPFVGQLFDNCEEAYAFYNLYGLTTGFGVRKCKTNKSMATGDIIRRRYVCDREGWRKINEKIPTDREVKRRRTVREGCKAKMEIKLTKDEKWEVRTFIEDHCHDLTSPPKRRLHHSHNTLHKKNVTRNLMNTLRRDGLGPTGIAKAINAANDGLDSAITPSQVKGQLRAERANNMGQEAVTVAAQFQQKRAEDPNFYFSMELDVHGNLRSLFWTDSRARESYRIFSDVIVFDVTYKINRYRMPFAPFTGVNHHRQSTLLGCALLADETEETFIWLFEEWLKCMFDQAPGCIITDMDIAMRNAIRRVFPNTRHRFCKWHIDRHLVEHVPARRDETSEFTKDYNRWYYRRSRSDSETEWEKLAKKYNIDERHWLGKMWELREHWVPAYFRDIFTAGMTSSSRSESINSFFDGFVNQSTTLQEFVVQYDKALVDRRRKEAEEDFRSKASHAICLSKNTLEEDAAKRYTRAMFDKFQVEFKGSIDCWENLVCDDGYVTKYMVGLRNEPEWKWYEVVYDVSDGINVSCECAMFETDGILCKHIICIMEKRRLAAIPDKYMLNRWTIGARYKVNHFESTSTGDSNKLTAYEKWCITSRIQRVLNEHPRSRTIFKKMTEDLDLWVAECEELNKGNETIVETSGSQVQSNFLVEGNQIFIHDPHVVKTKGRPKTATRFKSPIEDSQSQKPQRTCKKCGGKCHYTTTCKNMPKPSTTEKDIADGVKEHEEEEGRQGSSKGNSKNGRRFRVFTKGSIACFSIVFFQYSRFGNHGLFGCLENSGKQERKAFPLLSPCEPILLWLDEAIKLQYLQAVSSVESTIRD